MGASWTRTAAAFGATTAGCVAVGVVGAVVGVPARYGISTAQAIAVMADRPIASTTGWVCYALLVLALALGRARYIARRKPWIRATTARGSIWLWGGIGGPWIFVWIAWDAQFYTSDMAQAPQIEPSAVNITALWWWLGSLACLLIGALWSGWIAALGHEITSRTWVTERQA